MRKPSPISINSPREIDRFPARRQFVENQKQRGGAVIHRNRGTAQNRFQQLCRRGHRASLADRSPDRIRDCCSRARVGNAASGARPRFVCRTTPVALMTCRCEGFVHAASAASTASSIDMRRSCCRLSTHPAPRRSPAALRRRPAHAAIGERRARGVRAPR